VTGALRSASIDVTLPGSHTTAGYEMVVTVTDPVTGEQLASSIVKKDGSTTPGPVERNDGES
jgi:hypothetical protein